MGGRGEAGAGAGAGADEKAGSSDCGGHVGGRGQRDPMMAAGEGICRVNIGVTCGAEGRSVGATVDRARRCSA